MNESTLTLEEKQIQRNKTSSQDYKIAIQDLIDGIKQWRIWVYMSFAAIRQRYRRTIIGPFWTTLSLAIFISSMGILFSYLWHTKIVTFLPYFGSGYLIWTFFSTMVTESCATYTAAEGLMTQINLPYSLYAYLVTGRNLLVFLHQLPIYIVLMLLFHVKINLSTLLFVPGMMLIYLNGIWMSIALGYLCARFRDIQQIVVSILQISMFVTPIFWSPNNLGHGLKAEIMINGNPLYHIITIARAPLLGQAPEYLSWIIAIFITIFGWLLTLFIVAKNHSKLVFWL